MTVSAGATPSDCGQQVGVASEQGGAAPAPPADLLVSDIGLPGGMNGRQVADVARLHNPTLAVILMTGYAAPDLMAGMEAICKPFEPVQLADLVRGKLEPAVNANREQPASRPLLPRSRLRFRRGHGAAFRDPVILPAAAQVVVFEVRRHGRTRPASGE